MLLRYAMLLKISDSLVFLSQVPLALLISQLQTDIGGIPSLLRFTEVVSLLHEFGHVVCSTLNYFFGFIIYDWCITLSHNNVFVVESRLLF